MNTDKIYAEAIANEYAVKDTRKVVQLKKLNAKVKRPVTVFAYVFGIISTLILGVGMCFSMKVIGDGTPVSMAIGIVVGIIGIILVSVNYAIYKKILENRKKKYASDILRLAKEISEE